MKNMIVFLVFFLTLSGSANSVDFGKASYNEIKILLHKASSIDNDRKLSISELEFFFGAPDEHRTQSSWLYYVYYLDNNRKLELNIMNKSVQHGVLITSDGKEYLMWK